MCCCDKLVCRLVNVGNHQIAENLILNPVEAHKVIYLRHL